MDGCRVVVYPSTETYLLKMEDFLCEEGQPMYPSITILHHPSNHLVTGNIHSLLHLPQQPILHPLRLLTPSLPHMQLVIQSPTDRHPQHLLLEQNKPTR